MGYKAKVSLVARGYPLASKGRYARSLFEERAYRQGRINDPLIILGGSSSQGLGPLTRYASDRTRCYRPTLSNSPR